MKIQSEKSFQPVTLKITFETVEEILSMRAILNAMRIVSITYKVFDQAGSNYKEQISPESIASVADALYITVVEESGIPLY